jgi:hypothetical protein
MATSRFPVKIGSRPDRRIDLEQCGAAQPQVAKFPSFVYGKRVELARVEYTPAVDADQWVMRCGMRQSEAIFQERAGHPIEDVTIPPQDNATAICDGRGASASGAGMA